MSDESDNDSDTSASISGISIESEQDEFSSDDQFIYDDESSKLICIGSSFTDIPASVIHEYSHKTKVSLHEKANLNPHIFL
jgi:hypothetical protein